MVDDFDIRFFDCGGERFFVLGKAGDKEVIDFEPDALHAERIAEHLYAVDAIFERNAVENVSVEESGRRRRARGLSRLLDIECGNLLVSA